MHAILVLLRKDFAYFRRDRGSVILTFIVPFALIYLFGQIFGVNKTDSGPNAIHLAVVDNSGTPAGAKFVQALRDDKSFRVLTKWNQGKAGERPLTEDDLRPLMRKDEFRFALVLPPDLTGGKDFGLHLKILSDPRNAIETQTVTGLLQRDILTAAPQLFGSALQNQTRVKIGSNRTDEFNHRIADAAASAFGGDADEIYRNIEKGDFGLSSGTFGANGGQAGDFLERLVKIDRVQVSGADVAKPMATQLVGGWAIQFLLFALVASATSLFHEKDHGIFQRILSGPVPRSAILWSKFLYGVILGLLQLLILFFAGKVLFGIEIGAYLPKLLLVCLLAAAACSAFGMLLASISRTPEMARGLATFVILLMSALGGAWFPVSFMPEAMQKISRFTLVYWSIDGFLKVLWVHATLLELLPNLSILAGIAAVLLAIAWWRFNRGRIFD